MIYTGWSIYKFGFRTCNDKTLEHSSIMTLRLCLSLCFPFSIYFVSFAQEGFKPFELTLDQAIDKALENNSSAKQAKNRVRQAIYRKREAIALGLPQVDVSINYQNFIRQPVSLIPSEFFGGTPGTFSEISFGTKQTLTGKATLRQLLFDGSYLMGLQSAKTYLKIYENQKEKIKYTIRENIVSAYANALVSEERIKIIEKNLTFAEKTYRETLEIVKNGLLEEENAEQIALNVSSLKNQLSRAIHLKEVAYQTLMIGIGLDQQPKIKLSDNLETLILKNTTDTIDLSDFELGNHIDYRIAKVNVEINRLLVRLEKAKALPILKGFINYTSTGNSDEFSFFEEDQKYFPSSLVGITLDIPIFSGLERHSKTQQAKINYENAKIQFNQTQLELNLNAKNALSQYEFAVNQYRITKENLKLAERIEKKQNIKFSEGITTSQELTNAQQQLYKMQDQYLQSMYNLIVSKAQLDNAIQIPLKQ